MVAKPVSAARARRGFGSSMVWAIPASLLPAKSWKQPEDAAPMLSVSLEMEVQGNRGAGASRTEPKAGSGCLA